MAWASTPSGKSIPLDPVPVPDGNVEAMVHDLGVRVIAVHPAGQAFLPAAGCDRFDTHFATCPKAAEFKK